MVRGREEKGRERESERERERKRKLLIRKESGVPRIFPQHKHI